MWRIERRGGSGRAAGRRIGRVCRRGAARARGEDGDGEEALKLEPRLKRRHRGAQSNCGTAFRFGAVNEMACFGHTTADREVDPIFWRAILPLPKLQLLDRVLLAVTRSAAIELGQLKRLLKANGFTEADAHTIIPDRSSAPAKKEAPATPATLATPVVSPSEPSQGNG